MRRTAAVLPLATLLGACSAGPRTVALDLLRQTPDRVSPTAQITGGDEATRQLLLEGFTLTEDRGLAVGPEVQQAAFAFHLHSARTTRLVVRTAGPWPSRATVLVNDVPLDAATFPAGPSDATLVVPASVVRAGENVVVLALSFAAGRTAPVIVESIAIDDGQPPIRWTQGEAPSFEQRPGSEVSWLLEPDDGDRLEAAARILAAGGEGGTVEIVAETDVGPARVLWRSETGAAPRALSADVDLHGLSGAPVRLTARFASTRHEASLVWSRLRVSRAAPPRQAAEPTQEPRRPNVVVFLVDTLRPDHLSLYGYAHPTSPELTRFGAEAVVFEDAWTQSSWTNPTVASLLTGEFPSVHGIRDHHGTLAEGFVTLAELLKQRGYATAAVVVNPGVGSRGGFEQGFDAFHVDVAADAEKVAEAALERTERRPFFLYVHLMDPHYPYTRARAPFDTLVRRAPGEPIREGQLSMPKLRKKKIVPSAAELDYVRSLYDSEIALVDHGFGELVRGLKDRGLFDSTLIVFLSDHGEEFAEHGGYYHGHTLYNELTRGALVIKPAGGFERRRERLPAQTIDVYPTIAAAVGAPSAGFPGRDLLAAYGDAGRDRRRPLFAETDLRDHLRSVVVDSHKLVLQDRRSLGLADLAWLYDLDTDSRESSNLRSREPVRAEYMAALLRRHFDALRLRSAAPSRRELSEEILEELRALGYLDGGGD